MDKLTRELYSKALETSLSECRELTASELVRRLRDNLVLLLEEAGDELSPVKLERELDAIVRNKIKTGGSEQAAIDFLKQSRPAVEALWFRLGRSKSMRVPAHLIPKNGTR